VTAAVAPTVSVDGGAGTSDVFIVNAAGFGLTKVTGFETLSAGALAQGTFSGAGFSNLTLGAVAGALTFNTVAAGTGLTMTASTTAASTYTLATDTAADTLALTLTSTGALDGNTLNATKVETVNITLIDTDITKHVDVLTLVDASITTLKISGNAGLLLTANDTTYTSIDASGMTNTAGTAATGFQWASGANFAQAVTVKGSTTGGDVIDLTGSTSTKAFTVTMTAGTNTVITVGGADTVTGGSGADTIQTGLGNDTIVGGGGADKITAGGGADKITVSGNAAVIVQGIGASGANTSTTTAVSELTSGFDVIFGASTGLKIDSGNVNITAATLAGTNLAAVGGPTAPTDSASIFARGTYDAATSSFAYSATGADTALTYDSSNTAANAETPETIILVGYVVSGTTAVALGVFTL
jgi:hypothetical protein